MASDKGKSDTRTPATSATSATRATNEWGIPDWRDAASYGDVKRWEFNRWRWEFYRRRDDLRECFDAYADETYQHKKQHAGKPGFPDAHLQPHEAGFSAIVGVDNRKRFGYSNLPNPRIGEQPAWAISHLDIGGGIYLMGNGPRATFGYRLDWADVALSEKQKFLLNFELSCFPVSLNQDEICFTFDLNKPLEPQLENARFMMKHEYESHGKPIQRKRHPQKWLGYLRTLDARVAGAVWREIANLHPNTAQTNQTARDAWEQANALCFKF